VRSARCLLLKEQISGEPAFHLLQSLAQEASCYPYYYFSSPFSSLFPSPFYALFSASLFCLRVQRYELVKHLTNLIYCAPLPARLLNKAAAAPLNLNKSPLLLSNLGTRGDLLNDAENIFDALFTD
jgi:hypothetical protein